MNKIQIVNWLLTRRCNLKCDYCDTQPSLTLQKSLAGSELRRVNSSKLTSLQVLNKIKSLNEYFSQTLGDSFNSSNGVFKVNYRSYSDLSLPVGRGPDPSLLIKDSFFGSMPRKKTIEGVCDISGL